MKIQDSSANTVWYGKKRSYVIKDMTDEHLLNVQKLIKREVHRKYFCNLPREQWLNIIQRELKNRDKLKKVTVKAQKLATKLFSDTFKLKLGHAFNGQAKLTVLSKSKKDLT